MYLGFAALSYLPLHDAIAIGYASPLIVVILAALLLKETVRAYRWTAVGIGFVGVLIMLSPYLKLGTFGGGLTCRADAGRHVRLRRRLLLGRRHDPGPAPDGDGEDRRHRLLLLHPGLRPVALHHHPSAGACRMRMDLALFVLVGILGGIGQILVTQSYRYADTSVIAPFEYTTMIWALLFGWFVFGDLPTLDRADRRRHRRRHGAVHRLARASPRPPARPRNCRRRPQRPGV